MCTILQLITSTTEGKRHYIFMQPCHKTCMYTLLHSAPEMEKCCIYSRNVVFVTLQSLFIMALSNFTVFLIFDHCELLAIFQIRARLCVVHGQTVWSSMYVKGQFFLPSIYNAPKSLGGGCLWNLLEHFSKMSIESTLRTSWWLSSKLGLMCLLLEKNWRKKMI